MYIKTGLWFLILLFSHSAYADYNFNHISLSISSVSDSSLENDIDGSGLGLEVMKEENQLFGGFSLSHTAYDKTNIKGFEFDAKSTSAMLAMGKYTEINTTKLYAYIGYAYLAYDAYIGPVDLDTDDNGLVGEIGAITPLTNSFDLLTGIGVDTLFDETETTLSLALSFDVGDSISLEAGTQFVDDLDIITLATRFNYD